MTGSIDLNPNHLATVLRILAQHVPKCEVRAFGSRATWTSKDYSDLDLAVVGEDALDWRTLARLKEAFEESSLPMRVDVVDWHATSASFRKVIEQDYVVVQMGTKQATSGEWREVTLGDIAELLSGGTPSKSRSDYCSGSVPWVSAKDLKQLRLYETEDQVTPAGVENGTRMVPKNTVLVLVRGMTLLNDVPVAVTQRPMTFNQDIKAFRPTAEVDEEFLPYLILGNKARLLSQVDLAGHGTGRLNTQELKALQVHLPSLGEQRDIAHVLATLDDKIELNRCMNQTLEEMARALFKSWFVDFDPVRAKMEGRWRPGESLPGLSADLYDLFPDRLVDSELGEIPEGWGVKALGEVIGIHDSKRIPLNNRQCAERQGPYPYYGAAGIMDYVDDYLFDGVYVLIGEDGSVVDDEGYPVVQYVWGQFWVNNHAHVLIGKSPMTNEHLFILLWQIEVLPYVTGAVQPKLSQTNLKSIPMVAAPDEVCRAFSCVIQPFFANVRILTDQSRALAAQRDALLPGLVSGAVGVRKLSNLSGEVKDD